MQKTVRLDSHLVAEAKQVAVSSGRTLAAVIEDALREYLGRRKLKLPTFGGRGLRPGVNLDDSAALLELVESDRDAERRSRAEARSRGDC